MTRRGTVRARALGAAFAATVAAAGPCAAAGLLDRQLPDEARAPVRWLMEQLGETGAERIAAEATGVVATSPEVAAPSPRQFGDAVEPAPTLAIVRLHDPRFCDGERCLTLVGEMTRERLLTCAAFAAPPDVEATGAVKDVLGATGRGFAFTGAEGRTVVIVRPGLCIVIPPTARAGAGSPTAPAAGTGAGQAGAAQTTTRPAPPAGGSDEADGAEQ